MPGVEEEGKAEQHRGQGRLDKPAPVARFEVHLRVFNTCFDPNARRPVRKEALKTLVSFPHPGQSGKDAIPVTDVDKIHCDCRCLWVYPEVESPPT